MNNINLDDWRIETQNLLYTSLLFQELSKKSERDSAGNHIITLVDDAVFYAYQRTKTIVKNMGEYTLHDGDHLFRVLRLMEKLIPENVISQLSVPELMLLILTAFFHDVGMAPSEKDVQCWNTYWDIQEDVEQVNSEEFRAFSKYCAGYPTITEEIANLTKNGKLSKADLLKKHLISEYIRITHADRARKIIETDWKGRIVYKTKDLTREFAQICFSHNEEPLSLMDLDSSLMCATGIYVCLPFIGLILRLADILDFDSKRTPEVLFAHLFIRNPISLQEWNKHRSIDAWDISSKTIRFQASCQHPAIELSIRKFCDLIDQELSAANAILNRLQDSIRIPFPAHYKINLPLKVDRSKIGPIHQIGKNKPLYKYQETSFTLNKIQVVDLLMGTKLYSKPEVALRELIQNSIDACLFRLALASSWNSPYLPGITIKFTKKDDEDILEVIDNGIGMDLDIINKFYSSVGTSFYKSTQFYELKASLQLDYKPISRFGIGVLSCFMVSDYLRVNTKRLLGPYESGEALEIILEGNQSIFCLREGYLEAPGTITELVLRKGHPWTRSTEKMIIDSIIKSIPHPPFPIKILIQNQEFIHSGRDFKNLNLDELKDFYWQADSNLEEMIFQIPENNLGIMGKGLLALINSEGNYMDNVLLSSRTINVEGEDYEIERNIVYRPNRVKRISQTIAIDESGKIQLNESETTLAKSNAALSVHGIEVPFNIFPDDWDARSQKVRLTWPLPVLLMIDITGENDLNLNSARTEILFDDKWIMFEQNLSLLLLKAVKTSINNEPKWENLREILVRKNLSIDGKVLSEQFKIALDSI